MKRFAAFLILAAAGCSQPEREPVENLVEPRDVTMGTWRPVDANTGKLTALDEIAESAAQFPDSARVQLSLLNALIEARQTPQAYRLLSAISARMYRFTAGGERQINEYLAASGYPKPLSLTIRANDVQAQGALASAVPSTVALVEGALRERDSGRIYVTSIVSRGLFRQDGEGGWERVDIGPVGSLAGILQARDGTIWVSSAAYDPTPDPASAFRGLVGYDPRRGGLRRIVAPDGATPSDIALAPDGTLFAADPLTGAIYRAAPGADRLEPFVVAGTFRSAQGLAVSADGRFLYLSDYGYGLALVDLANKRVDRLPAPSSPFVDGTDGLWLADGELVAIQNGTRPMRIVAHRLAPDGRSIVSTRILESGNPAWTEPGSGSVSGEELLYVGTGQWDRFDKGGVPIEGKPTVPTEVRALSLAEKPVLPPKSPASGLARRTLAD